MKENTVKYFHVVVSIVLALFFLNAGVKKFIPKPPRPTSNAVLIQAVTEDKYESPASFKLTMKAMKQSGFLYMIGVFQILAALLIAYPATRLLGLLVLLPIVTNIFLLHVFMDNRMGENVETGLLLAVTLLLITYYHKNISAVFLKGTLAES